MNEDLEEIIKIAWKSAPGNTEYHLGRYICKLTTEKNKVIDSINEADDRGIDVEDQWFYRSLVQEEKAISRKINKLTHLVSFLRGS